MIFLWIGAAFILLLTLGFREMGKDYRSEEEAGLLPHRSKTDE